MMKHGKDAGEMHAHKLTVALTPGLGSSKVPRKTITKQACRNLNLLFINTQKHTVIDDNDCNSANRRHRNTLAVFTSPNENDENDIRNLKKQVQPDSSEEDVAHYKAEALKWKA